MKFGALLRTSAGEVPELQELFTAYKQLKKHLKVSAQPAPHRLSVDMLLHETHACVRHRRVRSKAHPVPIRWQGQDGLPGRDRRGSHLARRSTTEQSVRQQSYLECRSGRLTRLELTLQTPRQLYSFVPGRAILGGAACD